jgi:uncharacterized protein YkwD
LLLNAVNDARQDLPPLSLHDQLGWAAKQHSLLMATKQDLSHDGWTNSILVSGFKGSSMGQNIALNVKTPEALVSAWMQSPGHRNNILSNKYKYTGFGCIIDDQNRIWWTQNFGG